jgi:hypothetical protein
MLLRLQKLVPSRQIEAAYRAAETLSTRLRIATQDDGSPLVGESSELDHYA